MGKCQRDYEKTVMVCGEVPKLRGHELIDDFIQKSESSDASDTRREFLVEKDIQHSWAMV